LQSKNSEGITVILDHLNRRLSVRKLVLLFGFFLSFNVFANAEDGVKPLNDNPTEAQRQIIRDAAKDSCDDKEDDQREECVMDYFANHNLEEEPSCD
jgi:hypothetical protein